MLLFSAFAGEATDSDYKTRTALEEKERFERRREYARAVSKVQDDRISWPAPRDYSRYEGDFKILSEEGEPLGGAVLRQDVLNAVGGDTLEGLAGIHDVGEYFPNDEDGPVFVIGPAAFAQARMTRVVIPEGITNIGPYAFQGCVALKEVILPKSLEYISRYAFQGCRDLSIPDLKRCTQLKVIGMGAFAQCIGGDDLEVKLPRSLKHIGAFAFYGDTGIKRVRFNRGLDQVGYKAFADCDSLSAIPGFRDKKVQYETAHGHWAVDKDRTGALDRTFLNTEYGRQHDLTYQNYRHEGNRWYNPERENPPF